MAANVSGYYTPAAPALHKSKQKLPDVTLMLLGKTGAGKSSLGNAILNLSGDDAFEVTFGFAATQVYSAVAKEALVHDRMVKVVDTPGVMDTNGSNGDGDGDGDEQALQGIAEGNGDGDDKVLQGIAEGIACCCKGVDVFLLVIRFDIRLTREEIKSVNKLESLFGPQFWRHVILVYTHGDCIENDLNRFEQELSTAKKQIPWLKNVTSKLRHPPILFDASTSKTPKVAGGQMNRLMVTVDMLVSKNKAKYTNELFAKAKAELKTKENSELRKNSRQKTLELKLSMEKTSQLQSEIEKFQAEIERLEQQNLEYMTKEKSELRQISTQITLELNVLREENSKLQSEREKYQAEIAHLVQQILECKKKLDAVMKQAVEKTKEEGRKLCSIL